jgi:hypothetical protein
MYFHAILLRQDKLIGPPLKGEHFNGQVKRQCAEKVHSFYSWPIYDEAVHKNPYEI